MGNQSVTVASAAERAWREAHEAISSLYALHPPCIEPVDCCPHVAAAHAALDACVRAVFQEGFDIGLSAAAAACRVENEFPRIPPWLPAEGKEKA
jgi:hypothetical protein